MNDWLHPILSCEQSLHFEQALLGEPEAEWAAMEHAGSAVAAAILEDWRERGNDRRFSINAPVVRLLVLAGKGHNGGDALLAATALAQVLASAGSAAERPESGSCLSVSGLPTAGVQQCEVVVCRADSAGTARPLCRRAWEQLLRLAASRPSASARAAVSVREISATALEAEFARGAVFLLCLDGLLGMQFRPPLRAAHAALLGCVNAARKAGRIGMCAAVDLPSGLGDTNAFCADFTYATGIVKEPVLQPEHAAQVGRLRYLDLGFFTAARTGAALEAVASPEGVGAGSGGSVLTAAVLDPLRDWRPPLADKRHYGHLFIVGGSAAMPGALLMNVLAALHAGVGLLTVFAPESVAAAFAARAPEAMWVPWPQTDDGTLSLSGQHLLAERLSRADALLMGSGMGQSAETNALLADIAHTAQVPLVLDADALHPPVLAAAGRRATSGLPLVLTPHAGEFARLSALRSGAVSAEYLRAFCREHGAVTILKGAPTRVADAGSVAYSLFGGPVLARGGSGDVLAGLTGALLAQSPGDPLLAARRAASWHGLASEYLARSRGAVSVTTSDLIAALPSMLHSAG